MKRLLGLLVALFLAVPAAAQTARTVDSRLREIEAGRVKIKATGSATARALAAWMKWINNRTPAEAIAEVFFHSDPSTAGFEGFDQIHQSFDNPAPQQATKNHGVWFGWNAGRHTGGTNVVAGKPALIMGFEDNYFDAGGDNEFGMEWYVEYWSPDGTSVQMLRPFYARIGSDSNLKSHANITQDIGTDGGGAWTVKGGPINFLRVSPILVQINKPTELAGRLTLTTADLNVAGTVTPNATADRVVLGILAALPTSSNGDYLGWANGIAGTLSGDLIIVPRTSVGGTARFYAGNGTPTEKASIGPSGLTIGAAGTGTAISSSIRATGTLPTAAIPAGTTNTMTITVTGAAIGAEVAVGGPSTLEAGLILCGYVSAAGTVTLRIANVSAGSITPAAAQTVSVRVFNP